MSHDMKSALDQPSQFHSGVRHWRLQRISAIALIPLSLWAVVELVPLPAQNYATALEWIHQPLSIGLLLFLVPTLYLHAALGSSSCSRGLYFGSTTPPSCSNNPRDCQYWALGTLGALFSTY